MEKKYNFFQEEKFVQAFEVLVDKMLE